MFVQWDHESSSILTGPQGLVGDGENWYPLVDGPEEENPRTQTVEYYFDETQQAVTWRVIGDPTPTYDQSRQWAYPSIDDQLDNLWHDINNGTLDKTGVFYTTLKVVKDQFQKP
jgi:hypothetical protein